MQLVLERLLRRQPSGDAPERWLEAVLAAYMAVVVLPSPAERQATAEQQLVATLSRLQQAAAVHSIMHGAAQQAAAAAATSLCTAGGLCQAGVRHRRQLQHEALQQLTSPACLEAAAVAQLLAQRAQHHLGSGDQPRGTGWGQAVGALLHNPPTQLELEVLCLLVLLPCWEAVLARLADADAPTNRHSCSPGGSASAIVQATVDAATCNTDGIKAAAQEALQLLCTACGAQPDAILRLHPALLAEVCRQSFRFTCCYAALLAQQQEEAVQGTATEADAARWRLAHATKYSDHVTDYVLAATARVVRA